VVDDDGLKWRMKNPEANSQGHGVVDPARYELWFKPHLESPEKFVTGDTTISGEGTYINTVINAGTATVQAGYDAAGMFSYLPMFDWNEGVPDSSNGWSAMPLNGVSYARSSSDSNVAGKYGDRITGGLISVPVQRNTVRRMMSLVLAQQVFAIITDNISINMCRDNSTSSSGSFLGKALAGDYGSTNAYKYSTSVPHLVIGGTTTGFGVDSNGLGPDKPWTQSPFYKGSHLKFQWFNGEHLRADMPGYPYPVKEVSVDDAINITDIAGNNDSLKTWVGMDSSYTLSSPQFAYVHSLEYDGKDGADLYTSIVPLKEQKFTIEEYKTYKKGAANDTEYTFGTKWSEHRNANYVEWADYGGEEYEDGQATDSRGIQYAAFLDAFHSGWNGQITVDPAFSRELVVRNPLVATASKEKYLAVGNDDNPWVPRGMYGGYNYGASVVTGDSYLLSDHLWYLMSDDIEDNGDWTAWSATDKGATLKWPHANAGSSDEWADVTWSASKAIDHGDLINIGIDRCFGVEQEYLDGETAYISGGAFENSNEDAVPTMWLAPGTGEDNGIILSRQDPIDMGSLFITPASGITAFRNTPVSLDLLVDPVKSFGVKLYDDSGSVNGSLDSGDELLYAGTIDLPVWSTYDAIRYFDEPVEGVSHVVIWVEEVYDSNLSELFTDYPVNDPGNGGDNYGGITEVRIFDADVAAAYQFKLANSVEESIRPGDNDNPLFYDIGADVNEVAGNKSEPASMAQMVVTVGTADKNNSNPSKRHDLKVKNVVIVSSSVTTGQQVLDFYAAKALAFQLDILTMISSLIIMLLLVTITGGLSIGVSMIGWGWGMLGGGLISTVAGAILIGLGTYITICELIQAAEVFGPIGVTLFVLSSFFQFCNMFKSMKYAKKMKGMNDLVKRGTSFRNITTTEKVINMTARLQMGYMLTRATIGSYMLKYLKFELPTFWSIFIRPLGLGSSMDEAHENLMNAIFPGKDPFSLAARTFERFLWDNDIFIANLLLLPAYYVQAHLIYRQPEYTWAAFQYYIDDFNNSQQHGS